VIVIPAIDLLGGKTVRLLHGDYGKSTEYAADPVETAVGFAEAGADWIHVVDLDGAKTGSPANLETIARICAACRAKVEVGGGVRSLETARRLLDAGAGRVVFGTVLVKDPELAARAFAELGDRAVAGVDARDGMVATEGWIEGGTISAEDLLARMTDAGAARFIVTDIATDGALQGPNLEFLARMIAATPRPVIASGGVATLDDLSAIARTSAEAAIVGRALYEGRFTAAEAIALCNP